MPALQSGTIATIAGCGRPGYAGDGGPATAALLNEPKSLAVDRAGNLYIADAENHVIRRVNAATGLMMTVAGRPDSGQPAAAPVRSSATEEEDPLAAAGAGLPDRYVQVADLSGTVRFVVGAATGGARFAGDGGPATNALLNFPSAVAVDEQGNLYIADTMNHRIRKVDARTGLIMTVAGTGQHRCSGDGGPAVSAALNEPTAVVVSGANLYIADQSNNRVRRVDLATGVITTVVGTGEAAYHGDGGPAVDAAVAGPSGLALGTEGFLYVADTFNSRIRMVEQETGIIRTVAGDGGEYRFQGQADEGSTGLSRPYGIALDLSGDILVTDSDSHLLRKWRRDTNVIVRLAGNGRPGYEGDGHAPGESGLNYPFGVAVDARGNIYIADTFNHCIRIIAA